MNRLASLPRSFHMLPLLIWFPFLGGCEDVMKQMPAGTDRYLNTGMSVGGAILNRPKFTEADEERMAQENARKFDGSHKMWEDPLLDAYLSDIVQRLVAQAHPRPFVYSLRVVNEGSVNAFTFGGGLLYVNAGLIARMENEAQLAMVLAHEIAHVTESHVTKGIEGTYGIQLLGEIARVTAVSTGAAAKTQIPPALLDKTYEYSMKASVSGHGRANESEADVVGLEYMVKAGYDPREAPGTFEQLMKEYGDQTALQNFFYGDHPTNKARIEKLTGLVQSKYSQDLETRKLITNTAEFKQRTRELVVEVGRLDYERKKFKTATAMFEKALLANNKDHLSHYYMGKIASETGGSAGLQQAVTHLTTAVQLNENFADAYRELGLAYYKQRNKPKAIEAFERYLSLNGGAKDAEPIKRYVIELKQS
jgi:beta-barrel assembly-enhancing protease